MKVVLQKLCIRKKKKIIYMLDKNIKGRCNEILENQLKVLVFERCIINKVYK